PTIRSGALLFVPPATCDIYTLSLHDALPISLDDAAVGGTWHLVAAGHTSWHGFAEAIFAEAVAAGLLPRAPRVHPITTAEFPTPARRPAYSCLDTAALERDFAVDLPSWQEALRTVVAELAAAGAAHPPA